jgi:hypothetical protein
MCVYKGARESERRERERERERGLSKEFKKFSNLRCNHFINLNICKPPPLVNTLKFFCEQIGEIFPILPKKRGFTKKYYALLKNMFF